MTNGEARVLLAGTQVVRNGIPKVLLYDSIIGKDGPVTSPKMANTPLLMRLHTETKRACQTREKSTEVTSNNVFKLHLYCSNTTLT